MSLRLILLIIFATAFVTGAVSGILYLVEIKNPDKKFRVSEVSVTSSVQQLFNKIQTLAFDENDADHLTPPDKLGPEFKERSDKYDDVDDYNNYTSTICKDNMPELRISVNVYYVLNENVQSPSTTTTNFKRIIVHAVTQDASDSLTISCIARIK